MRKVVPKVHWYKVEVGRENGSTYNWYGSSMMSLEQLIAALRQGEYIRLDNLLYIDHGPPKERSKYKEWSEWDDALMPTVYINPSNVVTVLQFKGDPRKY